MNIEQLKKIVGEWAASEPLIKKAYLFGSRVRGDHRDDSDLDVAVEIGKKPGDESLLATWIFEKCGLEERLSKLVPLKVQLEHLEDCRTPTVKAGIDRSSILVFEKDINLIKVCGPRKQDKTGE